MVINRWNICTLISARGYSPTAGPAVGDYGQIRVWCSEDFPRPLPHTKTTIEIRHLRPVCDLQTGPGYADAMRSGANESHVRVQLVGPLVVTINAHAVAVTAPVQCSVFAALAVDAGDAVSIDRLAERVWGHDGLPNDPDRALRHHIWRLRSLLEPDRQDRSNGSMILGADGGYTLAVAPGDVDLLAAEAILAAGSGSRAQAVLERRVENLEDLLSAWHSPALGRCRPSLWVDDTRRRCDEVGLALKIARVDGALALGGGRELVRPLHALVEADPYNEHLAALLATALFRSGRQRDALEALQQTRTTLRDELGLVPGTELRVLERQILDHDNALGSRSPSALSPPVSPPPTPVLPPPGPTNKGTSTTRLFGRDDVIAQSIALLDSQRIVTLIGTGGIGKTSTARAVMDVWRQQHPGEIRFVSFEEISPQGISAAVGHVVGTSTTADTDPLTEVIDRICEAVDLLVLDNCEHIAEEVGDFIDRVAQQSKSVRILATSRRPLETMYEVLVPLKPLDTEASRQLLHHQLQRSSIELDLSDSTVLAELLTELDGLPLAIELASASLRSVGVTELLSRWREHEPLPRSRRGRHERHQSIANAVRSTLAELDPTQLGLLRHCAFFPSDFDLAAIEATAGTSVLETLQDLVDHSLIEFHHRGRGARYRMLVPIRAEVRSGDEPLANSQVETFVRHFVQLASSSLDSMKTANPATGVAQLQDDLTNIAFAFELAADRADVLSMASIVHCVGLANGISPSVGAKVHLHEWNASLLAAIATLNPDDLVVSRGRTAAAWGLYGSSDGAWYRQWEAEDRTGDIETKAMAAIARFSRGQSSAAWELLQELDLASIDDPYMRAMFCGVGAVIAFEIGSEHGHSLTEVAVAAADARPSPGASFFAGLARSTQAFVQGNPAVCAAILEATNASIDGHDLVTLENMSRAGMAMTVGFLLRERDPAELLIDLLDRYLEQHSLDPASVAMALDVAALHLDELGQTREAAMLIGLLDRLGLSMAILRGARVKLEAKIDSDPELSRARATGSVRTTFEVLRSTRDALVRS